MAATMIAAMGHTIATDRQLPTRPASRGLFCPRRNSFGPFILLNSLRAGCSYALAPSTNGLVTTAEHLALLPHGAQYGL